MLTEKRNRKLQTYWLEMRLITKYVVVLYRDKIRLMSAMWRNRLTLKMGKITRMGYLSKFGNKTTLKP